MRVAVTGANGFLGRHVLAQLVLHDVEVTAVVRSRTDEREGMSFKPVRMDILNPPTDVFDQLGRPDVLIHLAWGGLANYHSLHHIERELPGHYSLLGALVRQGLKRMLCVGTCFEYGDQSGALKETNVTNPNNPYGIAKDSLRKQLQFLRKQQNFQLAWTRLFYLYGSGQSPRSLFSQLRSAVQRGEQRFNMSGGEQLRDYLPVETAAENLVSLALAQHSVGEINICSGKPISVRRLVERWMRQHGWSIELNLGHYPYSDYEPFAFWGDNTKLLRTLDQSRILKP